jgi:hypothetical protein
MALRIEHHRIGTFAHPDAGSFAAAIGVNKLRDAIVAAHGDQQFIASVECQARWPAAESAMPDETTAEASTMAPATAFAMFIEDLPCNTSTWTQRPKLRGRC